jgi:CheY-like chemotaxis protein
VIRLTRVLGKFAAVTAMGSNPRIPFTIPMAAKRAEPLETLGGLLDGLRTALDQDEASRLEVPVRLYVERALDAAMAAASRARDNHLEADAAAQLRETAAAARGLLAEIRGSHARAQTIMEGSVRLRERAIELSAAALQLRCRSDRLLRPQWADTVTGSGRRDLRGLRVLVVCGSGGAGHTLAVALGGLGAAVRTAFSVAGALDAYLAVLPDVLVIDVGGARSGDLEAMRELRERGALAPAIAVVTARDGDAPPRVLPGVDAVLKTPVDEDRVTATIAAVLRR